MAMQPAPQPRWMRWVDTRLPIFTEMQHFNAYPTPKNLNYWWNYGSLSLFVLVLMIATGIVLAMHYTPHADMAFDSVERIMRDVNYGWLIRYLHMNGASAFFVVVYIHIFRGLYYGSYKAPREVLWILGVVILMLMIATAFMGYSLVWGQMSFWAVTVITNLFSSLDMVIPGLGTTLGVPIVSLGSGYWDTRGHAPNENIRLADWEETIVMIARIIETFGAQAL